MGAQKKMNEVKTMRKNKKKTESVQELNQNIQRKETGVKQYQMFILRVLILLVIVWLLFFVFIGLTRMPSGDMYHYIKEN